MMTCASITSFTWITMGSIGIEHPRITIFRYDTGDHAGDQAGAHIRRIRSGVAPHAVTFRDRVASLSGQSS